MIEKMKLRTKIVLLVLAALLGMTLLVSYSVWEMRRDLNEGRKTQLKSIVEATYSTVADFQAQEAAGKLTREQAQKAAAAAIGVVRYGGDDGRAEYVYAFTTEGVGVYHPVKERIGQNMLEKVRDAQGNYTWKNIIAAVKASPHGAYLNTSTPRPGEKVPVDKLQFVKLFEPWSWVIGSGAYMDDIEAEFNQRLATDLAVAGVLVLLIAALGFVITRGVLRQVGGEPATAIDLMSRAAGGDLTVDIGAATKGSMLASVGEMVAAIRSMLSEIGVEALKLTESAEKISTAANEVSIASQSQSEATSSMAAAIEQLTVSINAISDSSSDSEKESSASVHNADEGVRRVQRAGDEINAIAATVSDASARIRQLDERGIQISSIAGVIKDIAGQTNLLALNAAIEAARAGEQGRGFAVVADEVRKLAERTSVATVEIEQMTAAIRADTELAVGVMDTALPQVKQGVQAAEGAAESLRRIKDGAQMTLQRIREVADSTKEQSMASTSIAQKVEEIATMVEETTAAMKSTAETADAVRDISQGLHQLVSRFRC
jgi:methyl-accepting chemotaxis protein